MMNTTLQKQLQACKKAALALRASKAASRNAVLETAAKLLVERSGEILAANERDLAALQGDATSAFRDRLTLNPQRLKQMQESLSQVAKLPDPLEDVVERRTLANRLQIRRVRSPLGVILMIFESRPNVATEAFGLAFKSGNVIILRGGKESMQTTAAIYTILKHALDENGFSQDSLWGITDPDRALTHELLQQRQLIDVVVPRGGDRLIEYVVDHSKIPIIKNDRGLCHVYVDQDADLDMAVEIVENAKKSRPGVCNSMETLLIHEAHALPSSEFLTDLYEKMSGEDVPNPVRWNCCPNSLPLLAGRPHVQSANNESWDIEYLDFVMNCKVVASVTEAISHIERHGSKHSEVIVTRSADAARQFQQEVDAAAVYWNASSRFTDGFELGLGGELGISTQKLHVRGPVGLKELTSVRWIIEGEGQIRK